MATNVTSTSASELTGGAFTGTAPAVDAPSGFQGSSFDPVFDGDDSLMPAGEGATGAICADIPLSGAVTWHNATVPGSASAPGQP